MKETVAAAPAEKLSPVPVAYPLYRWWVLANVVLVSVVALGIAWNYIIMAVPDVLGDLGLPIGQWGVLWAGISLGMLVSSLPAGARGDHFGARHSVGWGMVLLSLSLLLRATAAGFLAMFGAMVLFGLALGVVFANLAKAIAVWFPPDELGMASGVGQAGIGLGIGVATLVTPLLLSPLGGWRGLTRLLGYVTLALAAFWLLTVRAGVSPRAPRCSAITVQYLLQGIARLLCRNPHYGVHLRHLRDRLPGPSPALLGRDRYPGDHERTTEAVHLRETQRRTCS